MLGDSIYDVVVPLVLCTFVFLHRYRWWTKNAPPHSPSTASRTYPPGPPSKWVIGNLLHVPTEKPWLTFTQWRETYGPLVYFHGLGISVLVLNTQQAISDLLEKRGDIYSHRPVFTVAGELMGLDNSMPVMSYGTTWKLHKRLTRAVLSIDAVKKYHIVQEDMAALMCHAILKSPEDFVAHARLTAGRVVMAVTYGLPAQTADDKYITQAEQTMKIIGQAASPGAYLVDFFPSLKHLPAWFPFTSFRKDGEKGHDMIHRLVTDPFQHVQNEIKAGVAPPSFTRQMLESPPGSGQSVQEFEETVKWVAGTMYGAGGESTYSTILTFILAMILYPEVQRKAQREIDDVVGSARLPLMKDRPSLPYVTAVVKETMRWYPSLPLGLARRTAKDDVYDGYFIPGGTIVIPNIWSLATQGKRHPSKDFIPERFLEDDDAVDPYWYTFGFGRRACPGRYLGENSTFIFIGSILASFDILPPVNDKGEEIPVTPKFTPGVITYPEEYKCRIVPRSLTKASTIEERALLAKV